MKTIIKIFSGAIIIFIALVIAGVVFSYRHQERLEEIFTEYINASFDNRIHIERFHLSYIRNFPKAGLTISNISVSDENNEILRIGTLRILFDLRQFLNDSIKINRIILSDGFLHSIIDENGMKPVLKFSNKKDAQNPENNIHLKAPDLEIINLNLALINQYKKNETYISLRESLFKLRIENEIISLSGDIKAQLDSMKSNNAALFKEVEAIGEGLVLKMDLKNGLTSLEEGVLRSNTLTIIPRATFQKQGDGNYVILKVGSKGNLGDHLKIFNLPLIDGLEQLNEDAFIEVSYNQEGFVNSITRPYNQLKFDIRKADISIPELPYPIRNLHITGNYNNGEERIPESNNLIIDTISFDIEDSYLRARLHLSQMKDPKINGHLISEIHLDHIIDNDKLSASGTVRADMYVDGKISELKKIHLQGGTQAEGSILLESVSILFKKEDYRLFIPKGRLSLNNHLVQLHKINGSFAGISFRLHGKLNNVDQYILKEHDLLSGSIYLESDAIDLKKFSSGRKTSPAKKGTFNLSDMDLNLRLTAKALKGDFGSLDNVLLSGNISKDRILLDTLQLNYQEGMLYSHASALYYEGKLDSLQGYIRGNFKTIDFDQLLISRDKEKSAIKNNKDNKDSPNNLLPKNIDLDVHLTMGHGLYKSERFSNLILNAEVLNDEIKLRNFSTDFNRGQINVNGDLKFNEFGIWYVQAEAQADFPFLSIGELLDDFKKDTPSSQETEPTVWPEIIDIQMILQVDSLEYGHHVFPHFRTGIVLNKDELDIDHFTIEIPGGQGKIDLEIQDYLLDKPVISGVLQLDFDTVTVNSIYEMLGDISTNKKHKTHRIPHLIPENINLDIEIFADQIWYKNLDIDNIIFSNSITNGVFTINRLQCKVGGGDINTSGLMVQNEDLSIEGHIYSAGKKIHIESVLKALLQDTLSDNSYGNVHGYLTYDAEGLFKIDSTFNLVTDQNLFYSEILIQDGHIVNNPQIENTLSFIGHKSRENILINESDFKIYVNGNNIFIEDVLVNNSISNMDLFGKIYRYDSALNLNFRVSLTDLFFRSKQKRYLETREGQIRLFKDLSLYIELDGSLKDHKIKINPRKRHSIIQKELGREIQEIQVKYRERMNELYIRAEPKPKVEVISFNGPLDQVTIDSISL